MGKPRALRSGDGPAGVGIEYVRGRGVLRLSAWNEGPRPVEPLEVSLDVFCETLGIDPDDLGRSRDLMLFAGSDDRPQGGLRDLVGMFESLEEARQAFHRVRGAGGGRSRWAELVALHPDGRIVPVCWFGRPTPLAPVRAGWWPADHQPAVHVAGAAARGRARGSRRWWRAGPAEAGRPDRAAG